MDGDGNSNDAARMPSTGSNQWVKLNVGGTVFTTTKLTLTRDPESFFCRMCDEGSGWTSNKDENGAYLIDRDAKYFRPILNYLRHGKLIVDDGLSVEGVLEEAEFYNLAELIEMIKTRPHPQYKIARCRKSQIMSQLNNIESGWKFEQVVFVRGFDDGYGERTDSYLLVTSKINQSLTPLVR